MEATAPVTESPRKVGAYGWYVGWVLLLVTVFSMLDRKALVMLAEPIKQDLHLSDTQLGLLTGGIFTLVYAVSSFPLARLADRHSLARIIGWCVIAWSALTAGGSLATGFYTLAATRVGIAFGEAGASPASHALLAQHFPPEARGRAYGILLAGGPVGILLGLALAGWLNDAFSWRVALVVLGLPGILVGLIVLTTIRDIPPKVENRESFAAAFVDAVRTIWGNPALRYVWLGLASLFVMNSASNAMLPAFVMRDMQLSASTVGLGIGIVLGVSGFLGSLISGWASDRLAIRSPALPLRLFAIGLFIAAPLAIGRLFTDSFPVLLVLVAGEIFLISQFAGPTFTTLQSGLRDNQRALASAVFLFGVNGIGASFGPLLVGIVSDTAAGGGPTDGDTLRLGLLSVMPFILLASFFFYRASVHRAAQFED